MTSYDITDSNINLLIPGKGTAAAYGFRWQSLASGLVRGLLGFDTRPNQDYFQTIANNLPGGENQPNIGLDAKQYPLQTSKIAGLSLNILGFVSNAKNTINDALTGLGSIIAGNQDPTSNIAAKNKVYPPGGATIEDIKAFARFTPVPRNRFNQFLERKGFLKVDYPKDLASGDITSLIIPFYENPRIEEKRQANYARLKIFSRNEPVRLWIGAEARNLTLSFTYTTPHILYMGTENKMIDNTIGIEEYEDLLLLFQGDLQYINTDVASQAENQALLTGMSKNSGEAARVEELLNKTISERTSGDRYAWASPDVSSLKSQGIYDESWGEGYQGRRAGHDYLMRKSSTSQPITGAGGSIGGPYSTYYKALDLVHKVTNIIRTTVVGSTREPDIGPPVVRLNFGEMYRNVPCICTNYSFIVEGNKGYDNDSLIPRSITFKMELEEFRQAGQLGFDKYDAELFPDGVPGWNDFFMQGSMDPLSEDVRRPSTGVIKNKYRSGA